MHKRTLVLGLTVVLTAGALTSCGNSGSSTAPNPGQGTLYTFIGDQPACNAISFRITLTGLTLSRSGSTIETAVLNPSSDSIRVNFGDLRDSVTFLGVGSAYENSYERANLRISAPTLVVYDPTLSPPVKIIPAKISNNAPTFSIMPPLTVTKGKVNAVQIDFDMLRSLGLDSQGNLTPNVNPVLTATPLTATSTEPFIRLDDLVGFVRSVSPSSTTAGFTGGFLLQMLSSSLPQGPTANVNLTSETQMYGVSSLPDLQTDSFVEVNGYVDSNGNLVADDVEVEFQEDPLNNKVAMIGPIVSLLKDASGNLTGFNLWVRGIEPGGLALGGMEDNIVQVNLSSTTAYQYSSRRANFAGLSFGPTALAAGQEVIVHGPYTRTTTPSGPATTTTTTVAAYKVYLKLQTLQGNFATLVQAGSDDKTGAFQLAPCCTLLQGAPVLVLTNYQTRFLNVTGLGALTAQPTLLIKGLPFYEPSGGAINGVTVPPGTLVVLAKQVHRLQ